MKRNYPPNEKEEDHKDQSLIDQRLNQLFLIDQPVRKVLHSSKGTWCDVQQHVRLHETAASQHFGGMKIFSTELRYNYLNPHSALYLVELRQLIVYSNGFPLSIAEAYELFLKDSRDFKNYLVFSYLNRYGFFCLKPSQKIYPNSDGEKSECNSEITTQQPGCSSDDSGPLFNICALRRSFGDVLKDLRSLGPQECPEDTTKVVGRAKSLEYQFEVYKRETFSRNKPRKDGQGKPDFFVIIPDKSASRPPTSEELMATKLKYGHYICERLLFALIDCDTTTCFSQFDFVNINNNELNK